MRILIAGIPDISTTARYFERAALAGGHDVAYATAIPEPKASSDFDLALVIDPMLRNPRALRAFPCPTAGYFIDVHQENRHRLAYARYVDHVFVAQKDYTKVFQDLPHPSVTWLPLGCEPAVHFVPGQQRIYDVGFVGKFANPGSERYETLKFVLAQFDTNDVSRFYTPGEMGLTYSRSKIVFNRSINGDLNMRFFEALASGALLVTDRIANGMEACGRDGVHYVTYGSKEEAVDVIRYYLTHPAARETIAQKGQELALSSMRYADRLQDLLALVTHANSRQPAPARHASAETERVWRSECQRLQGATFRDVGRLIADGHLTWPALRNSAVAVSRGKIRPLRQKLAKLGIFGI